MRICCVCNRERDRKDLKTFFPTDAEKDMLRKGEETDVLSSYDYCLSCIRLMSDRETAIPLLTGIAEVQARHNGVADHTAERIAKSFETFLKGKVK